MKKSNQSGRCSTISFASQDYPDIWDSYILQETIAEGSYGFGVFILFFIFLFHLNPKSSFLSENKFSSCFFFTCCREVRQAEGRFDHKKYAVKFFKAHAGVAVSVIFFIKKIFLITRPKFCF